MLNKRKMLALMVGIYALLDSAQTADWLVNYEPNRLEASLSVGKDFMLLFSALIIYTLGRSQQRLNVHVIRSGNEQKRVEEKKQAPRPYNSFSDRNSGSSPFADEPLSNNSLNSPPVEIQSAIQSLPSLT